MDSIKSLIHKILATDKTTRTNDMLLFARLIELMYPGKDNRHIIKRFENWYHDKMPNFNTVIRSRRALQVKYPELVEKKTAHERAKKELEFRKEYEKRE